MPKAKLQMIEFFKTAVFIHCILIAGTLAKILFFNSTPMIAQNTQAQVSSTETGEIH